MTFQLPSKAEMRRMGGLSMEVAGEGETVEFYEGRPLGFSPPPAKPLVPDWSEIKSIRKYFFRTGYSVWPAILYHPTEGPRLFAGEDEAAEVGIMYRKPTAREINQFGLSADSGVWDWEEGCLWRPRMEGKPKFDPANPETGKCYTPPQANPAAVQSALIRELATIMQQNAGQAATQQTDVLQRLADMLGASMGRAPAAPEAEPNALAGHPSREALETEAESLGIKVDGRWSPAKLAEKIEEHRKSA